MKPLSLVIPTSGNLNYVDSLLSSVHRFFFDYDLEVIIVCNPINIEFEVLSHKFNFLNLYIIQSQIIGVNRARQQGLDLAKNELVLFLDDDCRFTEKNQIDLLFTEITADENLFAIGGYYSSKHQHLNSMAQAYADNQMNWLRQGKIDFKNSLSAYLIGGFFILRKSICLKQGLFFDERMIFGGTEIEFFLQAHRKNLKIKLIDVSIEHYYPNAVFIYIMKVYKQGRGLRYIHEKGLSYTPKYLDFFKKNIWISFFDLVFWAGYFLSKNEIMRYLSYVLKKTTDTLNEKKISILNQFKKRL